MESSPRRVRHRRRAGITLTELLVAMAIIGVLVGLSFTLFGVAQRAEDRLEAQVAQASAAHAKKRPPFRTPAKSGKVPNQYIVVFNKSADAQAEASRLAQSVPAEILNVYTTALNGCSVRIQPGDVGALRADPAVVRVEQDQYAYPAASVFPTGVSRIEAKHAARAPQFQLTLPSISSPSTGGGSGARNLPTVLIPGGPTAIQLKPVVIMDTGIDSTHPDLNVVLSMGFGQPNGEDQFGHGTHCAGIVGARGVGVVGVFPGVPLWSLRVLDASGAGTATDIIAALDYLAKRASEVSVCNLSFGAGASQAMNDAVTTCANAGIVMCVAAGNNSADAIKYSPASASGAICVGALCDTDGLFGGKGAKGSFGDPDDTFASFSNFGSIVNVIAPGEDIYSTVPVSMGSYGFKSGTSMAAPHVAGLSALILQNFGATTGSGPRNFPSFNNFQITTPPEVLGFLLTESVEQIRGLNANKDTRRYPLITGRP